MAEKLSEIVEIEEVIVSGISEELIAGIESPASKKKKKEVQAGFQAPKGE